MPFFWGKWGFVLFHHRLFFPADVGHHRWNQKILQVEWSSIAFTSRSPGRPGCFHLSREHRKRLQQSKVGAVLLSLVEISNNTFDVDVMMCGPPIGLKSFYFVIKAGNMFGRFEPLKHPLNDCVDILCFYMSVYMFVFWRHPWIHWIPLKQPYLQKYLVSCELGFFRHPTLEVLGHPLVKHEFRNGFVWKASESSEWRDHVPLKMMFQPSLAGVIST